MLTLMRYDTSARGTRGILFVGGSPAWHVLEDPDRLYAGLPKIPGKTAIPTGDFRWVKTMSQRFKRILILLQKVPGFTAIRIHGGNTTDDTEGCPLIGTRISPYFPSGAPEIGDCKRAVDQLMAITPDSGVISVATRYLWTPAEVRRRIEEEEGHA
jgi:uncharacterized protein DUF5675